nr:hypothetical protein [uncultured Cohaesibacter sp.]
MKQFPLLGFQKPYTILFYQVPLLVIHRQGLFKQCKDQLTAIISRYAVDIHRATAGAKVNDHDVANPFPAIFVKAIMLAGQTHRLHACPTRGGTVARLGIDMQRMQTMGTVVAVNRAHIRGQKNHLLAVRTAKFPVRTLPAFCFVLSFLAIGGVISAEVAPPVGILVVKHGVMPNILE